MQNKYTRAQRGVSLSRSVFSVYLSLKRENERFFARFMRSFDRGARFAFASRVFSSSFVRARREIFFSFFLFSKKETTALFPAENSPLLVCRQNRIGFCFTRAPLPVRESIDRASSKKIFATRNTRCARIVRDMRLFHFAAGVRTSSSSGKTIFSSSERARRRLSVHFFSFLWVPFFGAFSCEKEKRNPQ